MYVAKDHRFMICAYKESAYLEECICSLKKQSISADIGMATSTPCEHISRLAEKYNIPLYVNEGQGGIANDWNFALKAAGKKVVTLAHQDDIYCEDYLEKLLKALNENEHPLLFFTDYGELRDGEKVTGTRLLQIKRIMLLPLRLKGLRKNRWVRRRILSLGSPISCPTVSYILNNLEMPVFEQRYRGSVDWQTWEKISRMKGSFVFWPEVLMYHRIHEESETSAIIRESVRTQEDYEMFCRFWPKWIAKILMHFYAKGQDSNRL